MAVSHFTVSVFTGFPFYHFPIYRYPIFRFRFYRFRFYRLPVIHTAVSLPEKFFLDLREKLRYQLDKLFHLM